MRRSTLLGVVLGLAVAGCSGEGLRPNGVSQVACTSGTGSSAICYVYDTVTGSCSGGTQSASCPSAGLTGCCTSALSGDEACYYDPSTVAAAQQSCESTGDSWSSTPVAP
jgi:hypothetical protein